MPPALDKLNPEGRVEPGVTLYVTVPTPFVDSRATRYAAPWVTTGSVGKFVMANLVGATPVP